MEEKKEREPFEIIKARHYANTFSGEGGEFVLQDLMKFCGMMSDGFGLEPGVTQYNSGKRAAICYIMERLQLNEMSLLTKSKLTNVLNSEFQKSLEFEIADATDYEQATFKE